MTTRMNLKTGRRNNRNETLVRDTRAAGLKLKTRIQGGRFKTVPVIFY